MEEVEASEQRRATVETRWRQLNSLVNLALELGIDLDALSEDDPVVWQRWARLKASMV